jgi:hypothetical protein
MTATARIVPGELDAEGALEVIAPEMIPWHP